MLYHSHLLSLLTLSIWMFPILASPIGGRYRNIGHRHNIRRLKITDGLFPRVQEDIYRSSIKIGAKALPTIPVQGPKPEEERITITKTASASTSISISTSISMSISATTIISTATSIITHEVTVSVTVETPKDMQTFTLTVGKGESIATLPGEVAPTPPPIWSDPNQYQSIAPAPIQPFQPPPPGPIGVRQAAAPAASDINQSLLSPPALSSAPLGPHYDELYGYTPIGVGFSPPPVAIGPDGQHQIAPNLSSSKIPQSIWTGSSVTTSTVAMGSVQNLGSALPGTQMGIPTKCAVATPPVS
ncbi:hypothetical protein EDC01DRAFT_165319 [Geopyxis carbonaria]|nr:hypothetical protein EDC01DRAFT_165319 [Geopyxis carbonaria]